MNLFVSLVALFLACNIGNVPILLHRIFRKESKASFIFYVHALFFTIVTAVAAMKGYFPLELIWLPLVFDLSIPYSVYLMFKLGRK